MSQWSGDFEVKQALALDDVERFKANVDNCKFFSNIYKYLFRYSAVKIYQYLKESKVITSEVPSEQEGTEDWLVWYTNNPITAMAFTAYPYVNPHRIADPAAVDRLEECLFHYLFAKDYQSIKPVLLKLEMNRRVEVVQSLNQLILAAGKIIPATAADDILDTVIEYPPTSANSETVSVPSASESNTSVSASESSTSTPVHGPTADEVMKMDSSTFKFTTEMFAGFERLSRVRSESTVSLMLKLGDKSYLYGLTIRHTAHIFACSDRHLTRVLGMVGLRALQYFKDGAAAILGIRFSQLRNPTKVSPQLFFKFLLDQPVNITLSVLTDYGFLVDGKPAKFISEPPMSSFKYFDALTPSVAIIASLIEWKSDPSKVGWSPLFDSMAVLTKSLNPSNLGHRNTINRYAVDPVRAADPDHFYAAPTALKNIPPGKLYQCNFKETPFNINLHRHVLSLLAK